MNKLNKKDYHYVGRYKVPLLYFYVCLPFSKSLSKKYKLPLIDGGLYLDGRCFFKNSEWNKIKLETKKSVDKKDDKFFKNFFDLAKNETNKVLAISQKLDKTKKPTVKLVEKFFTTINNMEYPWWFSLPIGDALEEILRKKLANKEIDNNELQSFFILEKPTFLNKQSNDLRKIKQELERKGLQERINRLSVKELLTYIKKSYSTVYKKINRHVEKYKWFGMMHLWGEPFDEYKFIEQLKSLGDKVDKKKTNNLNEELLWLKSISAQVCYWRQLCADTCAIASYASHNRLGNIGKEKIGSDYNTTMWLSPPEFIDMMKGKKIPNIKELLKRKKGYGLIQQGNRRTIFTGDELDDAIEIMVKIPGDTKEIKGMVANSGYAKGKVKIVLTPDDINKVKKGDIMVSSETTPDFVPAITKIAALVTDQGGISSHAAIVSREFNLPCIVGTKFATQMLKDNDLVEVDAKLGKITKL